MDNPFYVVSYVLLNFIVIYIAHKYFEFAFEKRFKQEPFIKTYIRDTFVYLYLTIVHLFLPQVYITQAFNIFVFILLSQKYDVKLKKRMMAIFLLCFILLLSEIAGILFSTLFFTNNVYTIGLFIARFVALGIVAFIYNWRGKVFTQALTKEQWTALVIYPVEMVVIIGILFKYMQPDALFFSLVIVLVINCLLIYIFFSVRQNLVQSLENKIETIKKTNEVHLAAKEKKYYLKQLEIMMKSNDDIRKMRHDYKNHFLTLESLVKKGNEEEILSFIHRLYPRDVIDFQFVNTNHVVVDSVINYYLSKAEKNNVKMTYDIRIPQNLNVDAFDLNVILTNLLDNAFEAKQLDEDHYVSIKMIYDCSTLFIDVSNSFDGHVLYNGDEIKTSKLGDNHGFGMRNIMSCVEKYNGILECDPGDLEFNSTVFLYVNE